uniref:Uncharacterized protein n=1 Tax=Sander lucioperca TaxID=283035 RepID=A0A8C9ZLY1_SANLU
RESVLKMFHKLTKLHGKLYLLMTQVATSDSSNTVTDVDHTAMLVYEEESSDEDEASGDEGLPDDDDSNWEEEEEVMEDTFKVLILLLYYYYYYYCFFAFPFPVRARPHTLLLTG